MPAPTAEDRALLQHFLAALAYRTQKALRGASGAFPDFSAGSRTRTPRELVRHMSSVLGYAGTFFLGGSYWPEPLPTFEQEVARFHQLLERLAELVATSSDWSRISPRQLLQGPMSDAMTHAGQLAMLRRLAGEPIPPENFIFAAISPDNLGPDQREPVAPDSVWPEAP